MQYLTREQINQLTDEELLQYVNEYLADNKSLNRFESYHKGTPKGYIKTRLKKFGYDYNNDIKQFVTDEDITINELVEQLQPTTNDITEQPQIDINEVLPMEQKQLQTNLQDEVLLQIKDILLSMNGNIEVIRENMEQTDLQPKLALSPATKVKGNIAKSTDDIKPIKSDETLIIRNFKVYPSLANRLKKLTTDTDYQVQQVFNALLDEILSEYGY